MAGCMEIALAIIAFSVNCIGNGNDQFAYVDPYFDYNKCD